MNIYLLLIFIILSCSRHNIKFTGEKVFYWSSPEEAEQLNLNHRNLRENLEFKLFTPKDSYYSGEQIPLILKLTNSSLSNTLLIYQPRYAPYSSSNPMVVVSPSGTRVGPNRVIVWNTRVRHIDKNGREVVKVTIPSIRLAPKDTINFTYDDALNNYGETNHFLLDFKLPGMLKTGIYKVFFKHKHLELDDKGGPILRDITSDTLNLIIKQFSDSIESEYLTYRFISDSLFFRTRDRNLDLINNYRNEYPNSVYLKNFNYYINKR